MKRYGLTPVQRDLLAFIRSRIEGSGVAPSFDEMKAFLGLASKSGVHAHLTALEERGAIKRLPRQRRAIALPAEKLVLSSDLSTELKSRFGGQAAIEQIIRLTLCRASASP